MTETANAIYPSLKDRAVFVTGGGGGIGASVVTHFAAQGSKVVFVDIDQAGGERAVAEVEAAGHESPHFIQCDLRDIEALRAAITEGAAKAGPFTVLVNNAAHDERHDTLDVTVEYWEDRMQVNLRHQFFAAQAVVPMMRDAGGGSIINFGSIAWRIGMGGRSRLDQAGHGDHRRERESCSLNTTHGELFLNAAWMPH